VAKSSAPINITTATTTQIVGLVGGQKIYPCSIVIDANVNSSAVETFQWEYGTGASCGTGTTALSGAMISAATTGNGPVFLGLAGGTLLNIPVSNAFCLVTVQVSGANMSVQGHISYVQQ
jgi:diaminopimelate epimerase